MHHHRKKLDLPLDYLGLRFITQRKLISDVVLAGEFYEHSAFNFTVIMVNNTIVVV